MTTFHKQKATCPLCQHEVTLHQVTSTNTFGGRTSDLRVKAAGMDPLSLVIVQCAGCGYSDFTRYFEAPRPLSEEVRAKIRAEVQPPQDDEHQQPSFRYATAAHIAALRDATAEEQGNLYLRAAWCCEDEGDVFREIAYRKYTIKHFEFALSSGEIPEDRRALMTYLIGELYRRTGDDDTARRWFDKVEDWADDTDEFAHIRQLAQRQRTDPKDTF